MQKTPIVVFGPGPQFKGGLANYTTSLAKAIDALGAFDVTILSWTQQYPAIIPRDFIDRASKKDKLEGSKVQLDYVTNYNSPSSWKETVNRIVALNPAMMVIQWSIAIQGLPIGFICKWLKKRLPTCEIIFDLHFVIQKEQSSIDLFFTKFALQKADSFVVHAYKTAEELKVLFPKMSFQISEQGQRTKDSNVKSVVKLFHPVYDMFKPDPTFDVEAFKQKMGLRKHVFLFFGFIRKYKGLHFCIDAFQKMSKNRDDVSLLIVGESFWNTLDNSKISTKVKNLLFGFAKSIFLKKKDDEQNYNPLSQVNHPTLNGKFVVVNDFVPNEAVYQYFQASEAILLFYEYATPSGVESMAYNFNLPVLATKVGHFPETIQHGYNGYLAEAADTESMAKAMITFLEKPIPAAHVAESAKNFSWENYARAILNPLLSNSI